MTIQAQVLAFLSKDRKVPAMKLVRDFLQCDLKTAYDICQLPEAQIGAKLAERVEAFRAFHAKELAKWEDKGKELG